MITLVFTYWLYDCFFSPIDLEFIVNTCKDLNNPERQLKLDSDKPIDDTIWEHVLPFLGFLYVLSFIIGALAGRLVRNLRLDTKFKLLRYKNTWFYLFSGEITRFKKLKHIKEPNNKFLFTYADILIDTSVETKLYSGVVVDYELDEGDSAKLSTVYLVNAERYKAGGPTRTPAKIPGNILVVDCREIRNINLRYVFEKVTTPSKISIKDKILRSRLPGIINLTNALIIVLLIPAVIFKTSFISWSWYNNFFALAWYQKVTWYFLGVQLLDSLNPFVFNKSENEFKYISGSTFGVKFIWIAVLVGLLFIFG